MKVLYSGDAINNPIGEKISKEFNLVFGKDTFDVSNFDFVMFDETSCIQESKRGNYALKEALKGNVPVLILNAGKEQKKAVSEIIGFSSNRQGIAYFVKPQKTNGRTKYFIHELPVPVQPKIYKKSFCEGHVQKVESVTLQTNPQVSEKHIQDFFNKINQLLSIPQEDNNDNPNDLKSASWVYSADYSFNPSGDKDDVGTPENQHISVFTTFEIEAFLNNYPETGAFQWLTLNHSGTFSTNTMAQNGEHHKGWFLTELDLDHYTSGSSTNKLFYYDSSPENIADKSQVTTSTGFSVTFDKGGPSGTFEYSNSETNDIYDWDITEVKPMSWQYYQVTPYDGRTDDFPKCAVKNNGDIEDLPKISQTTLQFDAQSVWKTNSVVKEIVYFGADTSMSVNYLITDPKFITGYDGHWWSYYSPNTQPFMIDLSVVS